jgi:hypothetical protein
MILGDRQPIRIRRGRGEVHSASSGDVSYNQISFFVSAIFRLKLEFAEI